MTFIAYGVNHKTTPLEIREKMVLSVDKQCALLHDLTQQPHIHGAMLLTTCNRTEIYCDVEDLPNATLSPWLAEQWLPVSHDIIKQHTYCYKADEGVRHLMRVACGLDSMVLGESQILGQMKQAYHHAHQIGTLNPSLQYVFQHVFNASKKIRSQTQIGTNPVSIAFAAVHLMRKLFLSQHIALSQARVLLIGAGDTTTLVAKYLQNQGVKHFCVASRNPENAQKLASSLSAETLMIHQLPEFLSKADIVISATHCPLPFIGKEMVEKALVDKKTPLFIIDLAVPRDVEANVGELEHVFLYNVDDLQHIAQEGLEGRQQAVFSAEQIIEAEVNNYLAQERTQQASHTIRQYRRHAKTIRENELLRAKQQLANGVSPETVLDELSHRIVRKLLHRPSLKLRQAASEERHDWLEYTTYLYEE